MNKTAYETKELRAYLLLVMRKMGVIPKGYVVVVEYRRANARLLGQGLYNRKWIRLLVLRQGQQVGQLLGTIEHEVQHNLGVRHEDMLHYCHVKNWEGYGGVVLSQKQAVVRVRDRPGERQARVLSRLAVARTKLKRLNNQIKKYERQARYYERRATLQKEQMTQVPVVAEAGHSPPPTPQE